MYPLFIPPNKKFYPYSFLQTPYDLLTYPQAENCCFRPQVKQLLGKNIKLWYLSLGVSICLYPKKITLWYLSLGVSICLYPKKITLWYLSLGVSICLYLVSIETLHLDIVKKFVSKNEKISTFSKKLSRHQPPSFVITLFSIEWGQPKGTVLAMTVSNWLCYLTDNIINDPIKHYPLCVLV